MSEMQYEVKLKIQLVQEKFEKEDRERERKFE